MKVVNELPLIEICTSGATIDDPWECMKEYNDKLKNEDGCDMVLPLCHLYEIQDERTCNEFDFPVIMSGHDHHRVDRMVNGTRSVNDRNHCFGLSLIPKSEAQNLLQLRFPFKTRIHT